jgi:glutathione S-transferase
MSRYKLHCFCQSGNSYKVALYLECAGLDWEPVFTDFLKGQTRDPAWREAVNEMGEAPVLEVDGRRLSQSGVILSYLADKTGKFKPATEDERLEALRWMLFDNHKFTGYLATYRFLKAFLPQAPSPDVMALLKSRFDNALGIVEKHLAKSKFIVGDAPTIADFSLAGYMFYPPETRRRSRATTGP